jgi:hypothetical protein
MNADTIPRSPNQMRGCIPPDGMIEGLSGTAIDILRKGHVEESAQETIWLSAQSNWGKQGVWPLLVFIKSNTNNRGKRITSLTRGKLSTEKSTVKRGVHVFMRP